jgi:hypothetical protein
MSGTKPLQEPFGRAAAPIAGKAVAIDPVAAAGAVLDAVVIALENMVIDDVWLVDQIKPPLMRLTYLPLKQEQQMSIGVFK